MSHPAVDCLETAGLPRQDWLSARRSRDNAYNLMCTRVSVIGSSTQPEAVSVGPGGHWAWLASPSTGLTLRLSAFPPSEVIHAISEIHDRAGKK